MNNKTNQSEIKELVAYEPQSLDKPKQDTQFAHESAKILKDIVKQNNWIKSFGGQSSHIMYEGWQTVGKYYGLSVKTHDAEYVEFGNTWGFKAKATVVNEQTGIEVGSAEAFCMSDEGNWRSKPKFQLASMAQTRAGSKALRQILGFVVALAGYNPTPAEEMIHEESRSYASPTPTPTPLPVKPLINSGQVERIMLLLSEKGKTQEDLEFALANAFSGKELRELTQNEAKALIDKLVSLPSQELEPEIDLDEAEKAVDSKIADPYKGKSLAWLRVEVSQLMNQGGLRKDFAGIKNLTREKAIEILQGVK